MHSNRISLSFVFLLTALVATPIAHAVAICPAGNAHTTPTTDFTDHGDGTVTHLKTGLMWKQCAEGQSGASCATGASATLNWGQALSAATTPFAGYSDWRLPNEKELKSIVETGCYSPTINDTVFPNTPNVSFWSSTSYAGNAFTVEFNSGLNNTGVKAATYYVRLVRGGQTFDSFDVQTDTIPTAFTFVDQTDVALSSQITSAPVLITGINAASNWTATSGTACVSSANDCTCDVAAHAASGTITNNQYMCAQHTSSASNSTATNTLVTVGSVSDTFTSTTLAALVPDSTPNAFTYVDQTNVALSILTTSAPVQISGINTAANWTASGGTACVSSGNDCTCDVAAHAASGTIANNQYICAQHTSSGSYSTATNTLVTVGGVSDTFTSTTLAAPSDTTPDAFTYVDQSGVARSTQTTSAPVQITGIDAASSWTTSGGTACISSGNNCTCDVSGYASSGTVTNNQYLCLRHTSSGSYVTATNTLLTVGGVSDTFTSTTLADTVPNGFSFIGQTGVTLSSLITSAPVLISGIGAPTDWSASGGTACVSSGNNCTCDVSGYASSGTVTNGQYMCVQHTSTGSYTSTQLTVGGVSDTFTSSTDSIQAKSATPEAIPTLSEWGALLLTGMLALFGMSTMRRRAKAGR